MKRSNPLLTAALTLLVAMPARLAAEGEPQTGNATPLYYQSIQELQDALASGKLSSEQLTQHFIDRIQALDQAGPKVNSVIELNPDALAIAKQRDMDRKAGKAHGLLFGIPILVKDNIDSGDKMQTSAGSLALTGKPAPRDATVLAKLRAAGAVLLGKTNLSEWANFRSTQSTSGWSGRGGLTHNPYVLDRNACGSSSGSGAAVSAGFATAALGTETDGSLTCPASIDGLVTIKPTVGLVSRAGIVPISHSQDGAGPLTRSVADAAILLTVMAGSDPRDAATKDADAHADDYTKFLDPDGLRGKHIGIVCDLAGFDTNVDRVLNRDVAAMRAAGVVVAPVTLPHLHDLSKPEMTVLLYEFKHDLDGYLLTRPGMKVKSLADVIIFDQTNADKEMPWFGQELLIQSEAEGPLTDKAYVKALADEKRMAGPEGIDAALADNKLDALMAPAGGPAWITDLLTGDHFSGGGDSPAAVAGYPSITVPAGEVHGLPVGMVFMAGAWQEPALIRLGSGFEKLIHARIEPKFLTETSPATPAEQRDDAPAVCPAPNSQ